MVEESLRFDSQTESASSNTLRIWISWLDESIKNRFWGSYLFEERAKISAVLFLEKRPVGKHSLCWSADHLQTGIRL